MNKNLKLFFIIFFILAASVTISCQGGNTAFDAFERAEFSFSLVNSTEGRIKDVDIQTENGAVSHPCGKMNPNDICVIRFAAKPDVLRIIYSADPVMGLGLKFDHDNVEQIWKFHRPGNGRYEVYNLTLDKDYFSLTAVNLSTTEDRFIDGFGFNNTGNPMSLNDYEFLSDYLNTKNEVVDFSKTEIYTKLENENITPTTYRIFADDDGDPLTPIVQLGKDDGEGNIIGPGITSGIIDYERGEVILSMVSEPVGKVSCCYHAPLARNDEAGESYIHFAVKNEWTNRAWLGFYKKCDLGDVIKNIFILQRNTSGLIQGYWDFEISHEDVLSDLRKNEWGTSVFNLLCTENEYK